MGQPKLSAGIGASPKIVFLQQAASKRAALGCSSQINARRIELFIRLAVMHLDPLVL
jgi:hypothetical protein